MVFSAPAMLPVSISVQPRRSAGFGRSGVLPQCFHRHPSKPGEKLGQLVALSSIEIFTAPGRADFAPAGPAGPDGRRSGFPSVLESLKISASRKWTRRGVHRAPTALLSPCVQPQRHVDRLTSFFAGINLYEGIEFGEQISEADGFRIVVHHFGFGHRRTRVVGGLRRSRRRARRSTWSWRRFGWLFWNDDRGAVPERDGDQRRLVDERDLLALDVDEIAGFEDGFVGPALELRGLAALQI